MDLSMPGMNGVKAIERLAGSHPYVKTILLTGHDDLRPLSPGRAWSFGGLYAGGARRHYSARARRTWAARKWQNIQQPGGSNRAAVDAKLSSNEGDIWNVLATTDLTIQQISQHQSLMNEPDASEQFCSETHPERVMTKLRMDTRTRPALVKMVFEFDENRAVEFDDEDAG